MDNPTIEPLVNDWAVGDYFPGYSRSKIFNSPTTAFIDEVRMGLELTSISENAPAPVPEPTTMLLSVLG